MALFALMATPFGPLPTGIDAATVLSAVRMTETLPEPVFVT
jgi:hypothetical protein